MTELFKNTLTKKREAVRNEIQTAFEKEIITSVEHYLMWYMTLGGNELLDLAREYLSKAELERG